MKSSAAIEDDEQEVSDVINEQHKRQSPAPPTHHNPHPGQILVQDSSTPQGGQRKMYPLAPRHAPTARWVARFRMAPASAPPDGDNGTPG